MKPAPPPVFAFDEADHLIRIHLKLELQNLGFVVVEDRETLALFGEPAGASPGDARVPRLRDPDDGV